MVNSWLSSAYLIGNEFAKEIIRKEVKRVIENERESLKTKTKKI